MYDIETKKSTLLIPPINPEEVIWSGLPLSQEEALRRYDVDLVCSSSDVNIILAEASNKTAIWTIANQVSDHITFLEFDKKDFYLVKEAIEECRVVKDDYEIALISKANEHSMYGHRAALGNVKHVQTERELEAIFRYHCFKHGSTEQAYHPIVAAGSNAATLHYRQNDAVLEGKLNMLLDAGAEWEMYASDITRTFPISGKFSKESREIYDLVLRMQTECMEMMKANVLWDDVHVHAHKVAISGLLELGILKGSPDDILKARTSTAFFPHGLGHYLGMDTHDTGGHPNYEDEDPMFRYLRIRGKVPAGAVVTNEPGVSHLG
jgi:Xaa-Pro dipeptidase